MVKCGTAFIGTKVIPLEVENITLLEGIVT